MNKEFVSCFNDQMEKPLELSCPLNRHSSLRVGGRADYFVEIETEQELKAAVFLAREFSIPYFIIGGGYNLLFDDAGFRGLIIKNSIRGIRLIPPADIRSFSGTTLEELVQFCTENELEGIEFLAGIPGTLGGAVHGNAGAFGKCIGDCISGAAILDKKGAESPAARSDLRFDYRWSSLKGTGLILLSLDLALRKGQSATIKARIEDNLSQREKKHPPYTAATAGSYFKNPDPSQKKIPSAASLLDKVGAKGLRRGGAVVSPAHANFIINDRDATAQDILDLAGELKKRVKDAFNIELQEEVIYLPEVPSGL